MRYQYLLLVLFTVALATGLGCSSSGAQSPSGADTDTDTDSDSDADTDTDSDSDTDTDNDGGVDCEENEDCDDDNPCTEDACDPVEGCVYTNNENPCDDGNECTLDDACYNGLCQGGDPLICNDDSVCTDDSCDPDLGCVYANNTADCDDGQYCSTDDQCVDGVCNGQGTLECDDDDPCTTDGCDDVYGCQFTNNTADCDDGDVCTVGDVCADGDCTSGTGALDCNDDDVCTDDSCHSVDGCQYAFNVEPCTDDDACTMNDVCYAGNCIGQPLDNDGDNHISDACGGDDCDDDDELIHPDVFEGPVGDAICSDSVDNDCDTLTDDDDPQCEVCFTAADCNDGNVCNGIEDCDAGSCVAGTPLDCGDGNPCTTDGCDPTDGCQWVNNSDPCDDGNACTVGDYCSGGTCSEYASDLDCDDSNSCTDDSCDTTLGCQYADNADPCDDGDACTVGDYCAAGACTEYASDLDCDDSNVCTDDSCDTALGCQWVNNSDPCDDGDVCTVDDYCSAGACTEHASDLVCDDSNDCTDDSCDPVDGCEFVNNTDVCNDSDPCTMDDACSLGSCDGDPLDSDGDSWVSDACGGNDCDDDDEFIHPDVVEGPMSSAICADGIDNDCDTLTDTDDPQCDVCTTAADCDDGNVCNGDEDCDAGSCVAGTSLDCDDTNVCTDDTCDPVDGCEYANNTDPCNDGDTCTVGDYCSGGSCSQYASDLDCDDTNVCTDDSCDSLLGCQYANNSDPCNDGDACTVGDYCSGGSCSQYTSDLDCDDTNVCTDDSCDSLLGCQYANNSDPCNDGDACTVGDYCSGGSCSQYASDLDCDDTNICTTDSCDTALGCQYADNSLPCNDGDVCTVGDYCSAGTCSEYATDLVCNDGEVCTDDSCDSVDGCEYVNNSDPCDDGDACTLGDYCQGGSCSQYTSDLDCDDTNICTNDSCNTVSGCQYIDNTLPCDDSDACTLGDYCTGGSCSAYTSDLVCDDSNLCTSDSCDSALGCVFDNNTLPCDDSDDCTIGDQCLNGSCVSGPLLDGDGDGYASGTDGCPGNDCDDDNEDIHPGAEELCDGLDNDCNWLVDEGCPECDTVVPADELRIDNDAPLTGYILETGDEVFNIFFVEAETYNVHEVQVGFWDFCPSDPLCTGGTANGDYSVHIYEDSDGLPGTELASTGTMTAGTLWDELFSFPLATPLALVQDQVFWVGVRSEEDQTDNLYLPLVDGGVLVPYYGAALYSVADDDYYGLIGNNIIRVEGCAEGPWLTLEDHAETPSVVVQAGDSVSTNGTLLNRGPADTADVSAVLSTDDDGLSVIVDSADYGVINSGGTASAPSDFTLDAAVNAFGIHPVFLDSTDGPNSWLDAWGIYIQGSGCTDENYTLATDNDTLYYYMPTAPGDETGQYFVVDATAFTATSVDVTFLKNVSWNAQFRLKVYTYRAGYPDKEIYVSSWQTVSGTGDVVETFNFPTPLTFAEGDTFWVTVESQDDLTGEEFGVRGDDGDTQTGSWINGVFWEEATTTWSPIHCSCIMRVNGCRSTELEYDSHTSSPDPIPLGSTATLDITAINVGGEDAIGVTGVLSSTHADMTVTQPNGAFGNITADGGTAVGAGFQVDVSGTASEYQYLLDLELTDGVNTWDVNVPVQLEGGEINLVAQNFETMLVGADIRFTWEVTNSGNIDALDAFDIDLYHDLDAPPVVGVPGDWSTTRNGLVAGGTVSYVAWLDDAPPSDYDSYVQVDVYDDVTETNESDNIGGPQNLLIGDADIFELLDPPRKWFDVDVPVEWRFVTGDGEGSMVDPTEFTAVQNGWQHWQDVPTATISFTQIADAPSGDGGYNWDGFNTVSYEDPDGDLGTGTLAACLPIYNGQTTVTNSTTFYRLIDADIVFNNNVLFCTNTEAASPSCSNEFDMEGVGTHEIGHAIGLDHPDVYEATMYWSTGPCDESKASLATSDINGVTFIYPI